MTNLRNTFAARRSDPSEISGDYGREGSEAEAFIGIPDAPITSVDIDLFGGHKGLIESSRNLCSYKPKATINFRGHNGKAQNYNLAMKASGCKKHNRHRRASR